MIRIFTKFLLILLFGGLFIKGSGQTVSDSLILYDSDFTFTEGVFPDFENVRYNNPIPKSRILSEHNYTDKDFFDRVLSQNKLFYYDNVGNKLEMKTSNVWGYSRNGFLYIKIDKGYFRITLIGSICHFIAYRTYESQSYPYNNYYNSYYPYSTRTPTTTTEMQQFLLDFKTGNVVDYSVEGVEVLLMSDSELHDEYMQLSKKKKKQMKFVYIRRYNKQNPLYLIKK